MYAPGLEEKLQGLVKITYVVLNYSQVVQGIGYALSESFPVVKGIPLVNKFKNLGLLAKPI